MRRNLARSLASEKSEALTLKNSGLPKEKSFWMDEHDLGLSRTLKYLCVKTGKHHVQNEKTICKRKWILGVFKTVKI